MEKPLQPVDHAAIKTSQVSMIVIIILAFIIDAAWLIALLALILAIGVLRRRPAFDFLYSGLLRRPGWVKPDVLLDHPEPHRFAQLLGTLFLTASSMALCAGQAVLGGAGLPGGCAGGSKRFWWFLRRLRGLLLAWPDESAWLFSTTSRRDIPWS